MISRSVADDFDLTTPDRMKRHPYWQELLRPLGLQFVGLVKMAAGGELWGVPLQRSPEQGPFSRSQKRALAALSSQLSSAAAVARALGFAAANAAAEAFERSDTPVALLNRGGDVLRLNSAAEALFDHDLRIVEKRVTSCDRQATAALDRALHTLLWAVGETALSTPVMLPREGRRPVLAHPMRLSAVSGNIFSDCQAIIVFIDLNRRAKPPQETLRAVFDLTAAEARLAVCVASGAELAVVADGLQISKETARNELKAIFQKTGTHRQAELVALLAAFLPIVI